MWMYIRRYGRICYRVLATNAATLVLLSKEWQCVQQCFNRFYESLEVALVIVDTPLLLSRHVKCSDQCIALECNQATMLVRIKIAFKMNT